MNFEKPNTGEGHMAVNREKLDKLLSQLNARIERAQSKSDDYNFEDQLEAVLDSANLDIAERGLMNIAIRKARNNQREAA